MYMGAALLVIGAVYVFLHGQGQVVTAEEDALDEEELRELQPV